MALGGIDHPLKRMAHHNLHGGYDRTVIGGHIALEPRCRSSIDPESAAFLDFEARIHRVQDPQRTILDLCCNSLVSPAQCVLSFHKRLVTATKVFGVKRDPPIHLLQIVQF